MSNNKHGHHHHSGSTGSEARHARDAYWKRAHRDWRLVVVVILMLAGMAMYVLSDDLSITPSGEVQQPMAADGGE